MTDRRRINGPIGGTTPPIFSQPTSLNGIKEERPVRTRAADALRKIFLRTGVTPSASGSAYLELEAQPYPNTATSFLAAQSTSALKLSCTVHGPRPLPRSAPFTPHIILTTHVKYAPFASRQRRGYLRDHSERDLAVHLEAALRGVIIGDRWPKSGVDVIITVLEGEEDQWSGYERGPASGKDWGMMNVLSGCITVAAAAIADAGIDCVDTVSGGVAALVRDSGSQNQATAELNPNALSLVLDPVPLEHHEILAACVVGYLPSRDEITDLWVKGEIDARGCNASDEKPAYEDLTDFAVQAARGSHHVLSRALKEAAQQKLQ